MKITLREFLSFARTHAGEKVETIGGRTKFVLRTTETGVSFEPGSKKIRELDEADISAYLTRFHETQSYTTTDYSDKFRNASYVLGIVHEIARSRQNQNKEPAEPKRPFRQPASYEAEKQTRSMLSGFLKERGFKIVKDHRLRFGDVASQIIEALDETGNPVALRARLCWRKDSLENNTYYSAAQLLSNVDQNDWVGALTRKIEREKKANVTHLLLVQRTGPEITAAACIPVDAVVPIWLKQRSISTRLGEMGRLSTRKKNHAENGSSPTLWLHDPSATEVSEALWQHEGVRDLVLLTVSGTQQRHSAEGDTLDDLPTAEIGLIGTDGAPRFSIVTSGVRRDPKVRAHVYRRSEGICERPTCGAKRDYPGFLDVHHILGAETSDRPWTCVALCPNCHRETHADPQRDRINAELLIFAERYRSPASFSPHNTPVNDR